MNTLETKLHEIEQLEDGKSLDSRQRRNLAFRIRLKATLDERERPVVNHPTNGDEALYPNKIGNFSKGLPHPNDLGEVDINAYKALVHALETGEFSDAEAIPVGGKLTLLNPLGGLAFNIEGSDSAAVGIVQPPPAFASTEMAAQAAEAYWMAFLRDVPFTDFNDNSVIKEAAADLTRFSGYRGPRDPVTHTVTPQNIFRYAYPGVLDGAMVSQFLLQSFAYDAIPVDPRIRTRLPVLDWKPDGSFASTADGRDFLTLHEEWLEAQNGFPNGLPDDKLFDLKTLRYPRSMRDLGHIAGSDFIYSVYFRAARILANFGVDALDDGNPYKNSVKQGGFATFGIAHLTLLIGSVHKAERHTWYQKWNVHRYLRPEEFGGRVDNHLQGRTKYPIHQELLDSPVLARISAYNRELNNRRFSRDQNSFLLPQEFPRGCPTHPSAPAGHAISAGACVTILKAWFKEDFVIGQGSSPQPQLPNRDGTALEAYNGPALTIGGELNKLCHNLSAGRDMSGVHWRVADNLTGNLQGEEVAIRILKEARTTYPEKFNSFTLTKFDGTTITI